MHGLIATIESLTGHVPWQRHPEDPNNLNEDSNPTNRSVPDLELRQKEIYQGLEPWQKKDSQGLEPWQNDSGYLQITLTVERNHL